MGASRRARIAVIALAAALVVGVGALWGWTAAPTDASSSPHQSTYAQSTYARSADGAITDVAPAHHTSTGCGLDPATRPGSTAGRSLTSDGRDRTYLLHLPRGYRAGQALPLVLAFHGRGQSSRIIESQSGLSNLPAIVAYPQGLVSEPIGKRAWESAPYAPEGVDDVAFTRQLLTSLEGSLCVDLDRVYAVGHSNGGGFAVAVGCELRGEFAAVAASSAAMYGRSVGCDRPMSVLEIHGTDDTIIPYDGADLPDLQLPDVAHWVRAQAAINGCRTEPSERVLGMFVTRFVFSRCASGRAVVHLRVSGGGHGWRRGTIDGRPLYAHIWTFLQAQPHHG